MGLKITKLEDGSVEFDTGSPGLSPEYLSSLTNIKIKSSGPDVVVYYGPRVIRTIYVSELEEVNGGAPPEGLNELVELLNTSVFNKSI